MSTVSGSEFKLEVSRFLQRPFIQLFHQCGLWIVELVQNSDNMSKMSMPSVRVFTITLLIFGVTFASTTAAVNRKLPSSEAETVEFGSTNKEERQFDFNRENYDPYDAQASAVAFRRYKEAQALKDGQVSSIHGATVHEDALPAASGSNSDDKAYEKKFYDPFFYFNGQNNANGNAHGQYPQYPSSSAVSASRRHGRLAHYQQTPIYAMPIRSRRNTGTTASTSTVSDGIDNNLLAEDVYFFRRDPDRNKQRLAEFEKSPYFYRESQSQSAQIQPEERQFPVSRSPPKEYFGPTRGRINDQYFSRLEQQPPRYNAVSIHSLIFRHRRISQQWKLELVIKVYMWNPIHFMRFIQRKAAVL